MDFRFEKKKVSVRGSNCIHKFTHWHKIILIIASLSSSSQHFFIIFPCLTIYCRLFTTLCIAFSKIISFTVTLSMGVEYHLIIFELKKFFIWFFVGCLNIMKTVWNKIRGRKDTNNKLISDSWMHTQP